MRDGMPIVRGVVLAFVSLLGFSGCFIWETKTILVAEGCPQIPNTIFQKIGVDAKVGASSFGKVATGDASLKIEPGILSAVSQSVVDDQVAEAYICAAGKRGELVTPEQFDHARKVAGFLRAKPSPEELRKFYQDNPFPKAQTTSEIVSEAEQLLASNDLAKRLGGVEIIMRLTQKDGKSVPIAAPILSKFIRDSATPREGLQPNSLPPDLQAAVKVLTASYFQGPLSVDAMNLGTDLKSSILPGVQLEKANLAQANLAEVHWQKSSLKFADLRRANLEYAHLEEADLSRANLKQASLLGAYLDMADLRGANLQIANLQGAQLKGAILEDADLGGADFREARIDGARWKGAKICGVQGLSVSVVNTLQGVIRC